MGATFVVSALGAAAAGAAPLTYWDLADPQAPGQITLFNPDDGDAANATRSS
jgi:hypothetical protein